VFFTYAIPIYLHPLNEESHPLHGLGTERSMEGSNLKTSLDVAVEISSDRVPLQVTILRLLHAVQSPP